MTSVAQCARFIEANAITVQMPNAVAHVRGEPFHRRLMHGTIGSSSLEPLRGQLRRNLHYLTRE